MLVETTIPGTDDWWLMQLASDFGRELPHMGKMRSYSEGTNALPDEWDAAMRQAYARFIHMSRLNMAELVVSARVNRMKPLGFRTAAPGDVDGDATAWKTWKRSSMKVGVRDFLRDVGDYGSAYLTVTGPSVPSPEALPLILHSNGWDTITRQYRTTPWLAEAALQVGYDVLNGVDILTLFRPGYMRQAYREARVSSLPDDGSAWTPGRGWNWVSDPVPLGYTAEVPVFRIDGPGGLGMYEKHLDTLDRITNTIRDRLTITAMQAFRQRAIDGELPAVYPPEHPMAGQTINYNELFKAGPAALWMLPNGAKMWESAVTDITPILTATRDDTKQLAAVTSTPLYILSPDAASGSAEGASLAREALTFSVEEWIDRAEIPISQAHATAFQALADPVRAAVGEIETIWAPVDRSSIIERASASAQAKAGGLPQRMIDEKIFQLTPAEIQQAAQDRADDAFAAPAATV